MKQHELKVTTLELSAITRGLALLERREQEHAQAVASLHDKILAMLPAIAAGSEPTAKA
jgi:predicted DNA-binding transcriptional regulator YafY